MKGIHHLIILVFIGQMVSAQNFIPNGSFEQYTQCPQRRNDGKLSSKWDTPTDGTSDYFNTCAPAGTSTFTSVDVPNNLGGTQSPRTGNAYAGFYACQNFNIPLLEYREYLQVTLDSLLVPGGRYQFEMYLSLGDYSNFASNRIGAYFSTNKISAVTDENLNVVPQIITTTYITDKVGWTKVSGIYLAQGGERYITIGVFDRSATHTTIAVPGGSSSSDYRGVAYYYIDDVSMTRECPLPEKIFGNDISLCVDQVNPITLSAATPKALTYLWNTTDTSSSIKANQSGTYIVKVSAQYCSIYDTIVVNYILNPKIDLGSDTMFCGAFSLPLDARNAGSGFLWNTLSVQQKITVTAPGTYFVRVNNGVCFGFDTIKVGMDLPISINLGNDTTLCQDEILNLDAFAGAGVSYRWNTGNLAPKQKVISQGKYQVTATKGACVAKDSIQVTYQSKPNLYLGPDTSLCFNQLHKLESNITANEFLWSTGAKTKFITTTSAGEYWLKIVNGVCTIRDTIVLLQKKLPVVNLGPDRKVCKESSVTIDLTNEGSAFIWNNNTAPGLNQLKAPGVFTVQVFNNEGCFASDTIVLDTFTSPIVSLGNDTILCYDKELQVDAGSFSRYQWQDGSINRIFTVTEKGGVQVTVWDANGCLASDYMNVNYFIKPDLKLAKLLKICEPDTIISVADGFSTYVWSEGSTTTDIRIVDYGKYTVIATDTNDCQLSATIEVENNCPGKVYVPNAFTPENKDGLNDEFYPVTINIKELKFWVYDRWGDLVFYTDKIGKGWDGTFAGKSAVQDVYVYLVDYVAANNVKGNLKGNVTLLK